MGQNQSQGKKVGVPLSARVGCLLILTRAQALPHANIHTPYLMYRCTLSLIPTSACFPAHKMGPAPQHADQAA